MKKEQKYFRQKDKKGNWITFKYEFNEVFVKLKYWPWEELDTAKTDKEVKKVTDRYMYERNLCLDDINVNGMYLYCTRKD